MTPQDIVELLQQDPTTIAQCSPGAVDVAIIDSGIDAGHERLRGRIASTANCTPSAGNCAPRIIPVSTPSNNDPSGHGTAVAGIVAALAPNARLHDIRVLDNHGGCTGDMLIAGMAYSIAKCHRVINMSLACNKRFAGALSELCERAYRSGIIVIASKRNIPLSDDVGFPAEHSSCIGVDNTSTFGLPYDAAYTGDRTIEFENHGNAMLVPKTGGGYTRFTGTSFATPAVTGLVSLFLGLNANLTLFEIKTILKHLRKNRFLGTINPLEHHEALIDDGLIDATCPQRRFSCPICQSALCVPKVFRYSTCPNCGKMTEHAVD